MRALGAAYLLFVSFSAARLFAASGAPDNTRWIVANNAGVAAIHDHRFDDALRSFRESWQDAGNSTERATAAFGLGRAFEKMNRPADAALWFERSAAEWRNTPGRANQFAAASHSLFSAYRNAGDYPRAEQALRDGLTGPVDAPHRAILTSDLADLLREEGRVSESRPLFDAVLKDSPSPIRQIDAIIGLADLDRQTRQWDSALARLESAARMAREIHSVELETFAVRGMGNAWLDSGNIAQAEPLLRRAVALSETIEPPDPTETGDALACLGFLYRMEGKPGLAEDALVRALEIKRGVLGDGHPQLASILQMLADVSSGTGDFESARRYTRQSIDILTSHFGEDSVAAAVALANSAEIEVRAQNFESARNSYQRALVSLRRYRADAAPLLPGVLERYAALLKRMHRGREAKPLIAEARSIRSAKPVAVLAESFASK